MQTNTIDDKHAIWRVRLWYGEIKCRIFSENNHKKSSSFSQYKATNFQLLAYTLN